ncbi:hypothetical protein LSTR_LSTR015976 [Laodelphax striatellus]|uniref:Uncharacterized protein n=1 Tax=Laodelphax striatellus TaxID=195883 RepID=A0A482XK65_LAOST|nr:hypothetical protein LSTR_LSTR015976 [Laodelphax striatellus]
MNVSAREITELEEATSAEPSTTQQTVISKAKETGEKLAEKTAEELGIPEWVVVSIAILMFIVSNHKAPVTLDGYEKM